jgi:hypothetical protein
MIAVLIQKTLGWVVTGGMPAPGVQWCDTQESARIVNHLLLKNSVLRVCRSGFFYGSLQAAPAHYSCFKKSGYSQTVFAINRSSA